MAHEEATPTLRVEVHPDGDDFTVLALHPDGGRMTLLEFEHLTTPNKKRGEACPEPRLGSRVRAVVEALRRSGQREFVFDPADPNPMHLSEEWVLWARQALEDTMWFIERRRRIREARRQAVPKFGWEIERAAILVATVGEAKRITWICPDCGQTVSAFEELCANATCPSRERYLRCTGNAPLRVVEPAHADPAAVTAKAG